MDRSTIEEITITITDPDGAVREVSLEAHSDHWGAIFDSGSVIGDHEVTVRIEDEFGRTEDFTTSGYEVVERIACSSTDECSDNPDAPNYCTGDVQGDYYCSPDRAREGEYAADQQSCQSGLAYDEDDEICYEQPFGAVNVAFVPLRFSESEIPNFESFAQAAWNRMVSISPIRDCEDPSKQDSAFMMHTITRTNCANQCSQSAYLACRSSCATGTCVNGCLQTHLGRCITEARNCANDELLSQGLNADLVIGVTSFNWPIDSTSFVAGASRVPSRENVNYIGDTHADGIGTVTHETGHSFGLEHLACGVGGTYGVDFCISPNAADCNPNGGQQYTMDYCDPTGQEFGPQGYSYMASRPFFTSGLEACKND
jgi:hypothetical protein